MKAPDFCIQAANLISGDRKKTHGEPEYNMAVSAGLLNAFLHNKLKEPLTSADIAMVMALMKAARIVSGGNHNPDDYIDLIGYTAIAGQIADAGRTKPQQHYFWGVQNAENQ